jgi:hypothetical protein
MRGTSRSRIARVYLATRFTETAALQGRPGHEQAAASRLLIRGFLDSRFRLMIDHKFLLTESNRSRWLAANHIRAAE